MNNTKNICVYCSSSDAVEAIYFDITKRLALSLANNGYNLVYGGAKVGLMGLLASEVKTHNRKVTGVMPQYLVDNNIGFANCDVFITTPDMRERKAKMQEHSDAFIALPGGFGTLEEILEILTLKQLGYHNKPVVFINTDRFYEPLIEVFENIYSKNFAKEDFRLLYNISESPEDAIKYINEYEPLNLVKKWY